MSVTKNSSTAGRARSGKKKTSAQPAHIAEIEPRYKPILPRQTIKDIVSLSEYASQMLVEVRNVMLEPHPRKRSPRFTPQQLQRICGIDPQRYSYALRSTDLPKGSALENTSKRSFSLEEVRTWFRAEGNFEPRPEGALAKTIAIGNFKGGVSKTSTAMNLAQGLTLLGRSCLLVDLDPQASLTTLFGILPDTEIEDEQTILPYIYDAQKSLEYAVMETYWDGIDLIPAKSSLFSAEFALPSNQTRKAGYKFWEVIKNGLEPLLEKYDVVIIDTPPALSYLTISAFMASDGIIVPIPPSALDYASSAQFWTLFADLAVSFQSSAMVEKSFDFIHVLLSKVDMSKSATPYVRDWIRTTYGHHVLPFEIPLTTVAEVASTEFGTIYDITKYEGNRDTYLRARSAYDQFVLHIDQQLLAIWASESG